jgi:tRNA-binding protein
MSSERPQITFDDFLRVDIRVGRIVDVRPFPAARNPAYQLEVDFGPPLGRKRSSAQLTQRYQPADLLDRQVLAVVNFPPRQIATFFSEVLVLGVPDEDGNVVLIEPRAEVPLGGRLFCGSRAGQVRRRG